MSQTLGVAPETIFGKTPVELGAGGQEFDAEYEAHIRQVLDSGESSDMELAFRHPGGGASTNLIRFAAERDAEGVLPAYWPLAGTSPSSSRPRGCARTACIIREHGRVNRAIQGADDLEQMMSDVLKTSGCRFSIATGPGSSIRATRICRHFGYPMEIAKPEYPGAEILNVDLPLLPDMAQNLREALESVGPVTYAAGTERPINKLSADQFGVKSMMMIALYPKSGKPWAFGLHQCAYPRVWT